MATPPADGQVQPASLDLRLGAKATRVRASFLPGPDFSVTEKLRQLALHEFPLADGAVLETGCVYIVPLIESLHLPADIAASANPKSSTGRLDVFTRVITDKARAFDKMAEGYRGPLFLEISPRTFPILVRTGSRLSQIRFRRGSAAARRRGARKAPRSGNCSRAEIRASSTGSRCRSTCKATRDGLVGYRAKRYTGVIDVDRVGAYDMADFWEPIRRRERAEIVLDPAQFYILVSAEAVHVPALYAAEMVPFDPLVGEFRVHYAGFFDPGFGHGPAGGHGSRAVLEVRSHEVPFILEHGQTIGRLVYEKMAAPPEALYGSALGSNYQAQGLKLSKHFRATSACDIREAAPPKRCGLFANQWIESGGAKAGDGGASVDRRADRLEHVELRVGRGVAQPVGMVAALQPHDIVAGPVFDGRDEAGCVDLAAGGGADALGLFGRRQRRRRVSNRHQRDRLFAAAGKPVALDQGVGVDVAFGAGVAQPEIIVLVAQPDDPVAEAVLERPAWLHRRHTR